MCHYKQLSETTGLEPSPFPAQDLPALNVLSASGTSDRCGSGVTQTSRSLSFFLYSASEQGSLRQTDKEKIPTAFGSTKGNIKAETRRKEKHGNALRENDRREYSSNRQADSQSGYQEAIKGRGHQRRSRPMKSRNTDNSRMLDHMKRGIYGQKGHVANLRELSEVTRMPIPRQGVQKQTAKLLPLRQKAVRRCLHIVIQLCGGLKLL